MHNELLEDLRQYLAQQTDASPDDSQSWDLLDRVETALNVERAIFYQRWDEADEETRAIFYPHLKDQEKEWLDEREEG